MRPRGAWRLRLAPLVLAVVGTALAPAAARAVVWAVQPTPKPAGAVASPFNAVACARPRACLAVGYSGPRPGAGFALAERWDGQTWQILPSPSPAGATSSQLSGVSCPTRRRCTAVGSYSDVTTKAFAARWNGRAWEIQTIPEPPDALGSELAAVSCARPRACTAVGTFARPLGRLSYPVMLAEHWNGRAWHIQSTPDLPTRDMHLSGVSCPRPRACTAVGQYNTGTRTLPLVERATGATWVVQPTPDPGPSIYTVFSGVSCPRSRACTAVGSIDTSTSTVTLAERWNGVAWQMQDIPSPAGGPSQLLGVSCPRRRLCTAVGESTTTPTGNGGALAERWDGATWTVEPTPVPPGALFSRSLGVSCASPRACTAIGYWGVEAGVLNPLAERRYGTP